MPVRITVESVSNPEQSSFSIIIDITDCERKLPDFVAQSLAMSTHCVLRNPVHNFLATVILVAAAILIFAGGSSVVEADEFPNFYLKAAKSVPRIGRRSGTFEDFFLKASKSVPRIGRRGYPLVSTKTTESLPWYPKTPEDLFKTGGDDFWSAENYARALEQSPELWEMIKAEAAAEAATSGGSNSEVWQREKRTGNEPAAV